MKPENPRALEVQVSAPHPVLSKTEQPLAEWFDDLVGELEDDPSYWRDVAKDEVAALVCDVMSRHKLKKAELARRLDKSPSYVTKVLKGTNNFTLDSLVTLARALDCRLEVRFVEAEAAVSKDRASDPPAAWNGVERRRVAHAYPAPNFSRYKNVLPFPKSRDYREVESRELQPQSAGASLTEFEEMMQDDRIAVAA